MLYRLATCLQNEFILCDMVSPPAALRNVHVITTLVGIMIKFYRK